MYSTFSLTMMIMMIMMMMIIIIKARQVVYIIYNDVSVKHNNPLLCFLLY